MAASLESMLSENPLLIWKEGFPVFSAIRSEHFMPAVEHVIANYRVTLEEILAVPEVSRTWENTIARLESVRYRVTRVSYLMDHMHNVALDLPGIEETYSAASKSIKEFEIRCFQDERLYGLYLWLQSEKNPELLTYDESQKTIIAHDLRNFRLNGIHLEDTISQRRRVQTLRARLTELGTQFFKNVNAAPKDKSLTFFVPKGKEGGIPIEVLGTYNEERAGWFLTVDLATFDKIKNKAKDPDIRREFAYRYYNMTSGGKYDNTSIIEEIRQLRQELAVILGYRSYLELALATIGADESPESVEKFLVGLANGSRVSATREFSELERFAQRTTSGLERLADSDIDFYTTLSEQERCSIPAEELRKYFTLDRALVGVFNFCRRTFGLQFTLQETTNKWHDSVLFYSVTNVSDGRLVGYVYYDPYNRPGIKRTGAYTGDLCLRTESEVPIVCIVTNFIPSADGECLLAYEEDCRNRVFHEFGHAVHKLSALTMHTSIGGTISLRQDVKESVSKFMELVCPHVMRTLAIHYKTNEPLELIIFEKVTNTRDAFPALDLNILLRNGIFDVMIHSAKPEYVGLSCSDVYKDIACRFSVSEMPDYRASFPKRLHHVFKSSEYAALYGKSYRFGEAVAAAIYNCFMIGGEEIMGSLFRKLVLEPGGTGDFMALLERFLGEPFSVGPYLRTKGIEPEVMSSIRAAALKEAAEVKAREEDLHMPGANGVSTPLATLAVTGTPAGDKEAEKLAKGKVVTPFFS